MTEPRKGRLVYFRGRNGDWYWHFVAGNGRIVADGGEGYRRLKDCGHGAHLVIGATDYMTEVKR